MDSLSGKEFDLVFDTIGGCEHWLVGKAALKSSKTSRFITIVGDGGGLPMTMAMVVWRKLKALFTGSPEYHLFLTDTTYSGVKDDMKKLTELVEGGQVKPLLDDRRFELTTQGVHDLIGASKSHRAKGKLILQVEK